MLSFSGQMEQDEFIERWEPRNWFDRSGLEKGFLWGSMGLLMFL